MKKYLWMCVLAAVLLASCNALKKQILIDSLVDHKARIDATENPALKLEMNKELLSRRVDLYDVVVKDVILSSNIDYDFCVVADMQTKKGSVECYIYSTDIKTIAKLVKGKSRIDVTGSFGRFFSLINDYYTMIDIIDASIKIKG